MGKSVYELQERLFGGLHAFHTERTAALVEALQEEFGEEVLGILEKTGADKYGLYRWHMERTLALIDTLTKKYGPAVMEVVVKKEAATRYEEGRRLAAELGTNKLEDILPFFTGGKPENVLEKNDKEATVKSTGCLAGRIACDLNRRETVYALHCGNDKDFVDGFNSSLGCEVVKTLMDGHDCCIHRIYVKE